MDSRVDLHELLSRLEFNKKVVFCFCCAECFLTVPAIRTSIARWRLDAWNGLRDTVNSLWRVTSSFEASAEFSLLLNRCEKYIPDDEDPTWDGFGAAQDAAILVLDCLEIMGRKNDLVAIRVSQQCLAIAERFDMKSYKISNLSTSHVETAVTLETERQVEVISTIEKAVLDKHLIARLMIKAGQDAMRIYSQ